MPAPTGIKIEVREYGDGTAQVWRGNRVLRPATLEWENEYQKDHSFMLYKNVETAKAAAKQMRLRETTVKVYDF